MEFKLPKQECTVTARVRPAPPMSIPYSTCSNYVNSSFEDSIWTIPPIPSVSTPVDINTSRSSNSDRTNDYRSNYMFSPICASDDNCNYFPQISNQKIKPDVVQPTISHPHFPSTSSSPSLGTWPSSLFRPVPVTPPAFSCRQNLIESAFHTPPALPTSAVVSSAELLPYPPDKNCADSPRILSNLSPPSQVALLKNISTPSTSTRSTTISNIENSDTEVVKNCPLPSPPINELTNLDISNHDDPMSTSMSYDVLDKSSTKEPSKPPLSHLTTKNQWPAPGVSPATISRISNGSWSSIRESILCQSCGQMHDIQGPHLYLYSEIVDPDLLCKICRQPLVDPLDTKCGHTFCTPCLKSHLVVQALCPQDKQIINYLECQQSSNIVKRLLDKLLVICPNSEHCNEVLCRCDLESHLKHWCRGTVVSCTYTASGCQFQAARALQVEHVRDCRFRTQHGQISTNSRFANCKQSVLFAPTVLPLDKDSSRFAPFSVSTRSPHLVKHRIRAMAPILDCQVTTIELPYKPNRQLGISFVGGSDTPLVCVVIQEIYLDGIVAYDGRLRPGDQILEANGIDLTEATHQQAQLILFSPPISQIYQLTVYRERACTEPRQLDSRILHVTLQKRVDKLLGIKLVGKKNLPGLYVLGVVPDSEADLDGRLHKDDRILEINGVDLRDGTQEQAAVIIRTAEDHVALIVDRTIRPQTPDIIRTASGDIVLDYGVGSSPNSAFLRNIDRTKTKIEFSGLSHPTFHKNRPCREQVLVVSKAPNESLGLTVAGGLSSQRGDTPVYVTNFDPNGVLGRLGRLNKGEIILAVNDVELLGLSHDRAVEALTSTRNSCSSVTIRLLESPEVCTTRGNFLPTWLYWLQLPRYCQIPRTVVLRKSSNGSFGFSIVGGNGATEEECSANSANISAPRLSSSPQPIVIKSIVPGTPAHRNGRLKCGDILLAVNQSSLTNVSHAYAVAVLTNCTGDVKIRVVSWPGTIV